MVQIHSVQWAWSEACVVRHKTTFYSAATENMLGGGLGKRISSTCALSVSRGLSTLGKAISGIPRGSSGFGLEGAAWLPLKLWTTHIPCGMQKKTRVRSVCSIPRRNLGRELPWGSHLPVFAKNLTWIWVQGVSALGCNVLTDTAGRDGLPWWRTILSLFTFYTGHSRDPHVCFIIPEPQTTQMMPFTGLIFPPDSDSVTSTQWAQLRGWPNLPHIWMAPFSTIPARYQHHCCGVYPTNPSLMHNQTHSTHIMMVMPVSNHAWQCVAWGHGKKKVHRSWHVCWWSDSCSQLLAGYSPSLPQTWERSRLQPEWVLC